MPRERLTIGAVPWASGLINQGGQATIPENGLWELTNVTSDVAGRLMKRPSMQQWGQTFQEPSINGISYQELFLDLGNFTMFHTGATEQSYYELTQNGSLRFVVKSTTNNATSIVARREAQPSDGTIEAGDANKFEYSFYFKANKAMPAVDNTGGLNDLYGFQIGAQDSAGNYGTLNICSDGIYYWDGADWVIVDAATSIISDTFWHTVFVSQASATSMTVTLDGTSYTVTHATADPGGTSTAAAHQFVAEARATDDGEIDCEIDLFQYRSGNDKFDATPIRNLYDWSATSEGVKHLVCVAGGNIYHDVSHQGFFKSLVNAPHGDVLLTPWLRELLISGSDGDVLRWTGVGNPKSAPAAMPRKLIACAAHQQRIYCVSARNPLRIFFSGANDISDWSDENSASPTLQSAWFDIPDVRGKRVTAMLGDFYGLLIIWTESSTWVWRSSGDPVNDGYLQQVSKRNGCVGPRAFDSVGSDVFFLGYDGVYSLSTVQEYGDVSTGALTANIRGLWQNNNFLDQKRIIEDKSASVIHVASQAKTYIAVRLQGDASVKELFEFNHDTKQWCGPWTVECQALDSVLLGFPGYSTLVVGTTDGRIATVNGDSKSDFGTTSYSFLVRSARLDGRSIDPGLIRRIKRWRALRLFILPRGGWNIGISWNVDGVDETKSANVSQNYYKEGLLDTTFVLNESFLVDSERPAVLTVPLDSRGRWLEFRITQDGDGEDLILMGFEVDFLPSEEDKENY